jgi:hypothetical protein
MRLFQWLQNRGMRGSIAAKLILMNKSLVYTAVGDRGIFVLHHFHLLAVVHFTIIDFLKLHLSNRTLFADVGLGPISQP